MPVQLNINQIMQYLPHRYPFLMIDAVEDVVAGEWIRARKNVSMADMSFLGHYPGNPVMPAVLQIEAMGQSAALLALLSGAKLDRERAIYVTHISECKFRKVVIPGDALILTAKVEKQRMGLWMFACEATVGAEVVSNARITATSGPRVKPPPLPADLPPPPEL